MIGLGYRSGYEIKQAVESSIRFFWTISQAQIYPSLDRLADERLVTGRSEPSGRRARRVYSLTASGRAALRAWLADGEELPFELRDVGLLKLFFADALPDAEAADLLDAVLRRSREMVETLRVIEPAAREADEEGNGYPLLTLELGIAFHEAMVSTCARFAARREKEGTGT
jgi:DNA-binding PadR family transcriptional regulator